MIYAKREPCKRCGKPLPPNSRQNREYHEDCKRLQDKEYSKVSMNRLRYRKGRLDYFRRLSKDGEFFKMLIRIIQNVMKKMNYEVYISNFPSKSVRHGTLIVYPQQLEEELVKEMQHQIGQAFDPKIQQDIMLSMENQKKKDKLKIEKKMNLEVSYPELYKIDDTPPTKKQLEGALNHLKQNFKFHKQTIDTFSCRIKELEELIKKTKK